MKHTILALLLLCCFRLSAQHLTPVDGGSSVQFAIKNFGLTVNGSFSKLQGNINFDAANLKTASFAVSVDAGTVNTNNGSRDKHLKKEDYFNVAAFPRIQFISTKITAAAGGYNMEGTLTIKGVSKSISFPFTAAAVANGYNFKGRFTINRRDFKVGGSSLILADVLTVSLDVTAVK